MKHLNEENKPMQSLRNHIKIQSCVMVRSFGLSLAAAPVSGHKSPHYLWDGQAGVGGPAWPHSGQVAKEPFLSLEYPPLCLVM